jgi:TRAP-type mannitol/chloroaromatic compound transport system permease small subunit
VAFCNGVDQLSRWVARLLVPVIWVIVFIIIYEVIMRRILNSPTSWVFDLSLMLFALMLLPGGYVLLEEGHVTVDILNRRFPSRVKAIVDLCTASLLFSFAIAVMWLGWEMAWSSFLSKEILRGTPWHAPLYPVKFIIPVSAALLLLQGLAKFFRGLLSLLGKDIKAKE